MNILAAILTGSTEESGNFSAENNSNPQAAERPSVNGVKFHLGDESASCETPETESDSVFVDSDENQKSSPIHRLSYSRAIHSQPSNNSMLSPINEGK